MRYLVIATHWNENIKDQEKYVAGSFDKYLNAELFRNAYNEHFKSNAYIVEVKNII